MNQRIGLHLTSFTFPGVESRAALDQALGIARAADEAGFDSFWLNDHLIETQGPARGAPRPETYTFLTAAAGVTSRLTLGALATSVYFRNPAVLARMASTLDAVSLGRAVLGVGAGHPFTEAEHRGFGLDFPPIKERMDRLELVVPLLKELTGGTIPILVAGSGEHRLLRIVARHGDLCNLSAPAGDTLDVVRHKLEVLRAHCDAVGRDYGAIRKTYKAVLRMGDHAGADAVGVFFDAGIDELIVQIADLQGPEDVRRAAGMLGRA